MISEVEGQYKAQDVEKQVREFWQSTDAYNKVRARRKGGKKFYFVDGPPYTTGNIHMGTAWNKVIKDSILRYRSMNGFHVKDTPGWDMHGLPIEVKVEESFGFKNKKDIEEYGVAKFIDRCKEFALRQKDDMTNQFKALGAWMDWNDPYMTLKNEYIEAAWWALKRANERGLLEKGLRVVNWCPRCETAIADAEVEYWDETDSSIYVKFPIDGETNTYIVIWTTTPWTIPANVGVAVNPTFEYSKIQAMKDDGHVDILIMASDLVESVLREGRYKDYEVVGKLSAEEMKELRYKHPLVDLVPRQSRIQHGVYTADFVTAENTGCVHIAPGHGLEDFELGMDNQMDIFCPVGENGRYTDEAGGKYEGKYVKEADGEVILDLAERGLLLANGRITHRYGHCWRCKTPIIYIATSQWFLKISDLRQQMLDEVAKINWYPEWAGSARFSDWISGARDWCISRQRYWGIPLPIWTCNVCGRKEVIGTQAELEEKSGVKVPDLHRPEVDNVLIDCPCGGKMKRSPDVFDVWFDSAVASWATLHFPRVKDAFDEWWPADFITEGHDQTRGWFYSQLGASMVSFGSAPYKSVLMHGFTLDEQGRKMSKSVGNVVNPGEVIDKFGADTLRLYVLGANAPWEDLHFGWEAVQNVHRVLNIFWNAYRFPLPYMVLDNFDASKADLSKYKDSLRSEDRWILSRVNSLVEEVNKSMESYELQRIVRAINEFVLEDLSRWYIQLVRPRAWIEQDDPDKLAAYATIYEVMVTLCKVTAPFIPFLSEMIYQNLVRGLTPSASESVHMCDWPKASQALIDKELEKSMALVREISEAASNARQKAGRKLRWPVSEIIVAPAAGVEVNLEGLLNVLKRQTNSKGITVLASGEKPPMNLEIIPVPKAIGPAFKGDAGKVIGALKGVNPVEAAEIKEQLDASGKAQAKGFEITGYMVTFKETPPENLSSANFSQGTIYINTTLTPELEAEGYSREVIRRIQDMRKEMDLNVEDQIKVGISVDRENVLKLLQGLKDYIANEVRASSLDMGKDGVIQGKLIKEWTIEDLKVKIGVETA